MEIGIEWAKLVSFTLAAGALVTGEASAQAFKNYATEGDWQIAVNQGMGPGCVAIQRLVDPDLQVQIGIDARSLEKTGYIAILVDNADGIQAGQQAPASFEVDGQVFTGTFTGQQTEGYGPATVPAYNANFIYDLATKKSLTISYGEGKKVIVDLAGAGAAFAALRTCQEAQ